MKGKKYKRVKLYEYRIRYNSGAEHSALDSYHYYTAENALDALSFHSEAMSKLRIDSQTISIEELNPYSDKWEDRSDVINQGA
jgi:hypothetical protein